MPIIIASLVAGAVKSAFSGLMALISVLFLIICAIITIFVFNIQKEIVYGVFVVLLILTLGRKQKRS